MFLDHPLFKPPDDKIQKIWRYMDFTKYVELLNSSTLYFTRADNFEDKFEGSLTRSDINRRIQWWKDLPEEDKRRNPHLLDTIQKFQQEEKKAMAINCWHMNKFESAAMWRLYLKSNEGIAIQSNYSRLLKSFQKTDINIHIGTVNYIDYNEDYAYLNNNLLSPYLHKRLSFEHEHEIRCVIWQKLDNNRMKVNLETGGIKVQVVLNELIENVFVSPNSPKWLTDLLKDVTLKFGYNFPVINSSLSDTPIY